MLQPLRQFNSRGREHGSRPSHGQYQLVNGQKHDGCGSASPTNNPRPHLRVGWPTEGTVKLEPGDGTRALGLEPFPASRAYLAPVLAGASRMKMSAMWISRTREPCCVLPMAPSKAPISESPSQYPSQGSLPGSRSQEETLVGHQCNLTLRFFSPLVASPHLIGVSSP